MASSESSAPSVVGSIIIPSKAKILISILATRHIVPPIDRLFAIKNIYYIIYKLHNICFKNSNTKGELMRIIKIICSIVVGCLIGFEFCYYVASEFMAIYFPNQELLYYMVLLATMLFCIIIINIILLKKINKTLFYFLSITYFCLLFMVLFYRQTLDSKFILNPLTSVYELKNPEMILQSFLNLIAFIPLGYYFKNLSNKYTFFISLIISLLIELIQGVFKLGYFDTFDIILYMLGIQIGYYFFKKFDIFY